jgi:hypothetical protein
MKATKMESFGFDVTFDDEAVSYHRVVAGDQTSKWASVGGNLLGPGHLRIGGFAGSKGSLTGDGQIVRIEFLMRATTQQAVTLIPENMIDGLKNANKTNGAIDIIICAIPTPTPLPVQGNGWIA